MATEHSVQFTSGSPETVLDPISAELAEALRAAIALPRPSATLPSRPWRLVIPVASRPGPPWPSWPTPPIDRYAFARVGYHRGLDSLRAAGWRGSGYVRWRHESNRGFLRSLHALELAAAAIGEVEEEQRCALFLRQLDPEWSSREL